MTLLKLTLRNIFYYRRAHALVLTGTLVATAILVGALLVGDSITFSLKQSALLRLGNIQFAMETRGRFFPADLADRLRNETGAKTAPALLFRGVALTSLLKSEQSPHNGPSGTCPQCHSAAGMVPRLTESRQINNIQILGVQDSFWDFATGPKPTLTHDGIAINKKLATELQVQRGDPISIRFSKPALMSRDAPLSSQEKNDTLRATFTVEDIVQDDQLGRFSLAANQQIPCTVFVNLPWLQDTAGVKHQANLLLAGGSGLATSEDMNQAIRKIWRLEDAGLTLRTINGGRLYQLECERIFMDPSIDAALADMSKSVGALTYLVNSIARTNGIPLPETPYSFVIALAPSSDPTLGMVFPGMHDNEIIVNRWLADQLTASPGDAVKLTYYEFGALNQFVETNRVFKICRVAEMSDLTEERALGPNFPGLTDAEKCAEWDIGMPLQKNKMENPANEAYWNAYRTTPKAIVTLKAGQEMWANQFGNLTAIRFRANENGAEAITEVVREHLNPHELGLVFLPIRQAALKAAEETMDFGQLFLGMSIFLIVASLMLTGLLFAFGVQSRAEETGIMLAMGFQPKKIHQLWIQECLFIAALGSIAGALLGTLYTQAMIWGLSHFWQGAVAQAEIHYHATFTTMTTGTIASFAFAMGSLILAIRRQTGKSAHALLSGENFSDPGPTQDGAAGTRSWGWLPFGGLALALGLIGYTCVGALHNLPVLFFAVGCLLLISLLGLAYLLFIHLAQGGSQLTPLTLGLRQAGRHPSRSLTVASLLACGCFLILAVSAMQEDIERDAPHRDSGTGGFALFGESTLPIQADLNSQEGREKLNLNPLPYLKAAHIISMKVRNGDDASCLNLNRAQSPTLIGVDPTAFKKRGAFQSSEMNASLWALLDEPSPDGILPGLAGDINTAQWGLQKKTGAKDGDILLFHNERGEMFHIRLVGSLPMRLSVFQGSILISAQAFATQYPSENGTRMFLIDTPPDTAYLVKEALSLKLEKWGVNITSTTERLKSFYAVESTYMAMFLILGGLGILLGSAGMTIVILRNIKEHRNELALLSATGYSHRQILRIVLAEYGLILGIGLGSGIAAALTAIWPALQAPGVHLPWEPLSVLICGMIFFQIIWILLAVRISLRAPLLDALRNQ